jgi:hypothetical protein
MRWKSWLIFACTLAAIALVTAFAPLEKTLGERIRLVYLHGAWVWAGKIAFACAALAGLAALVARSSKWAGWSLALGRAGLVIWLTYLPMSLVVQQVNWGGIFWDEPRWRIPLAFGVAALLIQAALWLFNQPFIASAVNLVFGVALWWVLGGIENILHPDSPIFQSGSARIQIFFVLLLLLAIFLAGQITLLFHRSTK